MFKFSACKGWGKKTDMEQNCETVAVWVSTSTFCAKFKQRAQSITLRYRWNSTWNPTQDNYTLPHIIQQYCAFTNMHNAQYALFKFDIIFTLNFHDTNPFVMLVVHVKQVFTIFTITSHTRFTNIIIWIQYIWIIKIIKITMLSKIYVEIYPFFLVHVNIVWEKHNIIIKCSSDLIVECFRCMESYWTYKNMAAHIDHSTSIPTEHGIESTIYFWKCQNKVNMAFNLTPVPYFSSSLICMVHTFT